MRRMLLALFLALPVAAFAQTKPAAKQSSAGGDSSKQNENENEKQNENENENEKEAELERYRGSLKVLASSNENKTLLAAMAVLRNNFPASRPVVVEGVQKGNARVRSFCLQVLGEKGRAMDDLPLAVEALKDQNTKVRRSAVMTIRKLGKEGFEPLIVYLPREPTANNRKLAVKTLERWRDEAAVPYLVQLLKKEKDEGVRNFIFTALKRLSKRDLGRDVAAWEAYAHDWVERERAKRVQAGSSRTEEKGR